MSQSGSGLQRLESLDNRVSHFLVSDRRGSHVHRLCVRGSSQRSRARHHKKPLSGFLQKGHRLGVDRKGNFAVPLANEASRRECAALLALSIGHARFCGVKTIKWEKVHHDLRAYEF